MVPYTPVTCASSRVSGSKTQEGVWTSSFPSSYYLECGYDGWSFSSQYGPRLQEHIVEKQYTGMAE